MYISGKINNNMSFSLVPIGKELRDLRKKSLLTQEQLCGLVKISKPTLVRIEKGEKVDLDILIKVSEYLDRTLKLRLTVKK